MLDFYSDFPAPEEEKAISIVTQDISNRCNFSILNIKKSVKKALDNMGGQESLGSYSGWLVHTKELLTINSVNILNTTKFFSFKTFVYCILGFLRLQSIIIEKRYGIGGVGYLECRDSFYTLSNKLPPLNNKILYTPIKR